MVVGEISEGTDLVVIGSGPGGYVAAIRAAQLGLDVTLVEKEDIGGICLNHGCIPSKALIHAADLYRSVEEADSIGIQTDSLDLDMGQLQEWKNGVVSRLTGGVEMLEEQNGVDIVQGEASFRDPKTIHVTDEEGGSTLSFEHCIIATGSRPIELPGIEYDGETVISSREALQLESVPDSLVVIGGGYIGMELGMVYQKLGSDVTVLEAGDRILGGNDPDAASIVADRAEELGMDIRTEIQADEVTVGGTATVRAGDTTIEASKVLVAVGREPNTEGLDLDDAGVTVTGDGFVETDERLQTDVSHIYAIGDVTDQPLLAHKASKEGKIAAEVVAGRRSAKDYRAMPACVYTDPEIAEVGLGPEEAREQGYSVTTGMFSFSANGRALTMDEAEGFVKLVGTEEDNVLLGAVICGTGASELLSELALAIEMGALVDDIALTVHPHPTLSEAVMEAADDLLGHPIHRYRGDDHD
jgi:dihydrolipoamide dehydrogenase